MTKMPAAWSFAGRIAALLAVSGLAACGSFYVDNTIHDLARSERVTIASPQSVQLLFDFQTRGVSNSRATDYARDMATAAVADSGIFASVSSDPQATGATLQVTVNNVPLTDNAFARGALVGATFGLVGQTVGDGYVCTVEYRDSPGSAWIRKSVRDAIYTSLGATASTPGHAARVASMGDAVKLMLHKCIGNALDALGRDPGFVQP
jgi:hypothetical protein